MNNLKQLRESRKLTQIQLGSAIGVAQGTLSGWENGKYEIDQQNRFKLADYFGVTIDYLLGRENEMRPSEVDERIIEALQGNERFRGFINWFITLPASQQEIVLAVMQSALERLTPPAADE